MLSMRIARMLLARHRSERVQTVQIDGYEILPRESV